MKLSADKPPIYKRLKEVFGISWSNGIIITYGDTVHCKYMLNADKMVHEKVHTIQQTKMDKDLWWEKYISDPKFRLEQEVEAYKAEAHYIQKHIGDRNTRAKLLDCIYKDLSSSMYGNVVTYSGAKELLK